MRLDRAVFSGKRSLSRAACQAREETGNAVVYPDLPIWGKLEIYDSPSDAVSALSDDEKEEQFVRLIMVADNTQLTNMLEQGKEVCLPDAALYMRVDKTCPLYWVTWEVDREADAIEIIVPKLPQKASRETILKILTGVHPWYTTPCSR